MCHNNPQIKHYFPLFLINLILVFACEPEQERITDDPSVHLTFSQDTVLFDTLFVERGSITKRLKVYNNRSNAIEITSIKLGGSNSSPYSLFVNGIKGKDFESQTVLGQDSILILIEVLIDPNSSQTPFIVEDSIIFETTGALQQVKLLAWGQNANFLNDSILVCNTQWTNDLPYVIMNFALVEANCSLTIEAGTKIYFHNNSALYVGGSLQVAGTTSEKVLFTNDRLDAPYNATPGQWQGIIFLEGSNANTIDNAIIKNSVYGIWLGTPDEDSIPDLEISNTIIENISSTGLIAFTSDLYAYNLLINNCGESAIANLAGGNYRYTHLTIASLGFDFFRELPSVVLTDQLELADGSTIKDDLAITFSNSIIWGNLSEELFFDFTSSNSRASFTHNLIKTEEDTFSVHNIINNDPVFLDPEVYNYRLDSISPAINAGFLNMVLVDIEGNPRDSLPDLGVYEYK